MSLDIGAALADARALWHRDRALLIRLAGPFLFLPALAAFLLLPPFAVPDAADAVARQQAMVDWYLANAPALIAQKAVELFGSLAVLVFYLDRSHRTVGEVLKRAALLFPALLLAAVMVWAILAAGLFAFIIPFCYAVGRLALVGPALVGEGRTAPGQAIARSFALTERRGWALFGVMAAVAIAGVAATIMVRAVGTIAGTSMVATAIVDMLAAAVASLAVLARTLIVVALYRRVTTR